MKSNIYTFLFFIIFFNIQKVKCQDEGGTKKHYIPDINVASPQAASITKVGEIPIDLSTGRMNYTIPIFEIKEGSFTMPINLSYNYSGLILDEIPGYAGVGWTLNIGGAILHSINGLDDPGNNISKLAVYNYINKLPPYDDYLSSEGLSTITHYLENVGSGLFDTEPDKYSVNAGNLNCSFYLDKDNNPIFLKNENYKVSGYNHSGFTITDDQGINYIFDKPLIATKSSVENSYDYITSFLLTEINFPTTTNKILFKYNTGISYSDQSVTQTLTQNSTQFGIVQSYIIDKNITYTQVATSKLEKIITNDYTIELQYSDNPTESGITVVSNLSVKDKFDKPVKSYDFNYSGWTGRRTNLMNVKYNGAITNEMEYDMTLPYPVIQDEKDYAKKDLWGYYNKNGIAPTVGGLVTPNDNPKLKPDFSSTKIGALKKITYQTKGYSIIDYEPNNVNIDSGNYNFPYNSDGTITSNAQAVTMAINNENVDQNTFTITKVPAKVKIDYNFTNHTQIAPTEYRMGNEISISKGSEVIFSKKQNWLWELRWEPTDLIISKQEEITISTPGTYTVKAFSVLGASAGITVTVTESLDSFNQTVGGMRVSTVQNCDFDGKCITTVYNYSQDDKSTGVMLQKPEFYSGFHIQDNLGCSPSIYVRRDFYNYTSIYPLSNFRGSPVLYKTVEKTDFGKDENNDLVSNGKTIFSYYGEEVSNSIRDLESYYTIGQLRNKEVKDNDGNTVATEFNNYVTSTIPNTTKFLYFLNSKMVREKRAQFSGGGSASGSGCALQYPRPLLDFQIFTFKYQSKNYILQKQENTNYFHGNSLKQTTIYDYNADTGFLKSKVTNNSENETIETKFYYPKDPEMVSEPFRNELIAKNMIGMPLVVQNYNGAKLSEQKTEYTQDTSTSNFLLPKYVYINKGTAPIDNSIDKKITYDKYDDKGNVLQYSIESGTPVCIIWGYNKTQPIAKIENIAFESIPAGTITSLQALSNDDTDNCMSASCKEQLLRNGLDALRTALPNTIISTYTYNPLVGVTSVTDPKGTPSFYEYDTTGRLKFIKDQDLNVLQKYCYNYKGQQVDCSDNSSTSVFIYKSIARNGSFTRDNCTAGGSGSSVTYNQAAGAYVSNISQADADSNGFANFNTAGQAYANANATCTFWNSAQSRLITRNNCNAGGTAGSVTYTVPAGRYSDVSQAGADAQAQFEINNNGQAYANDNATCTFWNTAQSRLITRNDCAAGATAGSATYIVPAGRYNDVSQAGADGQAQSEINSNGQAYANANATCTFWNTAKSVVFERNNCAVGGTPGSVTYAVKAGRYSDVSQAGADAQAQTEVNNNGQAYANATAICTFWNSAKSAVFERNNCAAGGIPGTVVYTVPAGRYSDVSQVGADGQAQTEVNNNGQAYANATATCTFWNTAQSRLITRNDCAAGGTAGTATYTVPAGRYNDVSQAGADGQAQSEINNNGQAYANANATCTFWNIAKSVVFEKNNCAVGGTPGSVSYNVPAGRYSDVSQAGADGQAQTEVNNNGQAYANATATCTFWNTAKSVVFERNNCAAGGIPGTVVYTVPAGRYSDVSQVGADEQAQTEVNNNGQAYANANATCTFYSIAKSGWFARNNCEAGGVAGGVTYTVPAGSYSDVSQAGADAQAQTDVNNNGQAYANTNTTCTFFSVTKSGVFARNNCEAGGAPGSATYTVLAGRYSDVSQAGADAQAQTDVNNNGQAYANSTALCTYYSVARSGLFSKYDCTGSALGSSLTFSQAEGAVYSNISQDDANILGAHKFYIDGNAYANANGTCAFYNAAVSRTANKSDCGAGRYGTAVTYTVPAGKYSSTISQANADQLAQNEIASNSTAYINANGFCSSETYNVFVADAEESQKKFWVTVTSSSSNHPQRTVSANFYYSYIVGKKVYWGYWREDLVLPAGVTNKTFIINLSFIGWPELESYTIN